MEIIFLRGHIFIFILFFILFFPSSVFFKIKKDVEMHNLAKRYLAELIKEECWNSMAVKGRALKVTYITPGITPYQ